MKIALVIERMDPSCGGREISTAQVAGGLARRGHDVTILCQSAKWSAEGVRVDALGRRGLLRVARRRNFVADVQRRIAAEAFDIVHAMLPVPGANVYQPRGGTVPGQIAGSARPWGRLGALRRAGECLNRPRCWSAQLERQVVADPNVTCLAVSRMVAEELAEAYGRVHRVRVVFNAVDPPDATEEQRANWRQRRRFDLGIGPDDPLFLIVARNFRLKGVAESIAAFAKWFHSSPDQANPRLVIVGRDLVEGYQRMASLRDVGRFVVFAPPTPDVHEWYAAADANVLLTRYDPCSRVVLEATCWLLPSITTVHNGAAEALADGAGIVVSSAKDIRAIVAALDELTDPRRRAPRVEACRRKAGFLAMDRHVDELLDAYNEAAARA